MVVLPDFVNLALQWELLADEYTTACVGSLLCVEATYLWIIHTLQSQETIHQRMSQQGYTYALRAHSFQLDREPPSS